MTPHPVVQADLCVHRLPRATCPACEDALRTEKCVHRVLKAACWTCAQATPATPAKWVRWHCQGTHSPVVVELPDDVDVTPYCSRCGTPLKRGGHSFYSSRDPNPRHL